MSRTLPGSESDIVCGVTSLPFNPLRPHLRELYGRNVYRVALDAGSTCPNRDGAKGFGGCVYCDVEGSGTGELKSGTQLAVQLEEGIERIRRREPDPGIIAYFQSYSNTYVAPKRLREVLAVLDKHLGDPIVAVSIATRPDTISPEALDILAELNERVPVWLELGLEVADDALLDKIQRYHTVDDFLVAVERVHRVGLQVVGHAILGIPGDGREGARRTADCLAQSGIAGIKVHNLMILRRTILEKWWRAGEVPVLEPAAYVSWLADFIERLHPDQIVHRMTGDAAPEELLAPLWDVRMNGIRHRLIQELEARGTRQGSLFAGAGVSNPASFSEKQRTD
ncbi:MAG: radical SAM protein (TIGR01212 family) [Planctomycetota bacterium]|jgi:radical SAM protein (TIGR01212 family)